MPDFGTHGSLRSLLPAWAVFFVVGCGVWADGQPGNVPFSSARAPESTVAPPPTFQCKQGPHEPREQALRRLSNDQLRYTVEDLIGATLPKPLAAATWKRLLSALANVPPDGTGRGAPFSTMDQSVSDEHVDAYMTLAKEIALQLTHDDKHVRALLACAPRTSEGQCIDAFLRRFGRLAFRHALDEREFSFLRTAYGAEGISLPALRSTLSLIFSMPQFLYQSEPVLKPVAEGSNDYVLHPYALAARLSYHYWQSMPDAWLLDAAEGGRLDDRAGLERALDHLLNDPRAGRSLRTFVYEWFGLQTLRPLDALVGDPVFDAFAGEHLPSPDLREAMLSDVSDSFIYHTLAGESFAQWLESPYSFARSEELATIYGVPPWDGGAQPPKFKPGTRAGLLTRAAIVASGSANTRPILKGTFIRRQILCDEVPPPPCDAMKVPVLSPEFTTRQTVEALTEQPGTSCASCHAYQINPLGFVTENYDGLGRFRREQRLFTTTGVEVARKQVNTVAIPRVTLYDASQVNGAAELTQKILESGKGEACFARQYVRFTYGRPEDLKADGCLLESIRKSAREPKGLRNALKAPALTPEFRLRRVSLRTAQ